MSQRRKDHIDHLIETADEDLPIVNTGSIESWERRNGRGFWGSASKGYIYDENNSSRI